MSIKVIEMPEFSTIKMRAKFNDKYFEFGEIYDVHFVTNFDHGISARITAKNGRDYSLVYPTLTSFLNDWEEVEDAE